MSQVMTDVLVASLWLVLIFCFVTLCATIYYFIVNILQQAAMDRFEKIITDQIIADRMTIAAKPKRARAKK